MHSQRLLNRRDLERPEASAPSQVLQERSIMFEKFDYLIIAAAFLSFLFSVFLWFGGQKQEGLFVGIWVPSILAAGIFFNLRSRR